MLQLPTAVEFNGRKVVKRRFAVINNLKGQQVGVVLGCGCSNLTSTHFNLQIFTTDLNKSRWLPFDSKVYQLPSTYWANNFSHQFSRLPQCLHFLWNVFWERSLNIWQTERVVDNETCASRISRNNLEFFKQIFVCENLLWVRFMRTVHSAPCDDTGIRKLHLLFRELLWQHVHTEWLNKRTSVGRIAFVLEPVCYSEIFFSSRFYYIDVSIAGWWHHWWGMLFICEKVATKWHCTNIIWPLIRFRFLRR